MNMTEPIHEYFNRMGNPLLYLMVLLNFILVMTAWFALLSQHATAPTGHAKALALLTKLIILLVVFDWFGKPALTMVIDRYLGESDV